MPADYRRYAIYYTPAPGPLAEFGANWLGWDLASGTPRAHPSDIGGLPAPIEALTETPRKYGLHATMKPPFRLAPGATQENLSATLDTFCAQHPPVALDGAQLTRLGRFLAITAKGDTTRLCDLAARTVRALDTFRAAPSEAEISRHTRPGLSPAQLRNIREWGYPHVMEQFRWHMTLTGKRPARELAQIETALAPLLATLLSPPPIIDALSLVGEDTQGFFHEISRAALTGLRPHSSSWPKYS